MKLNKKDLRKIQYEFNSVSNRLLQADFQDYKDVLKKFIAFLESTPIIAEYISQCGSCDWNLEDEIKEVSGSYNTIFTAGESEQEEVRNVFAVLKYAVQNNLEIHFGIAFGYSSSNKFQDKIKGFNDRFVMILIRHIESYLTKVGIDMGVDEKISYNVTVHEGQAIIATEGSTVTATNTVGLAGRDLDKLLDAVRIASQSLSPEEQEEVAESLEVIEAESKSEKPKKSMIKTALTTLKSIKGMAEFAAAVASLIQFIQPLI